MSLILTSGPGTNYPVTLAEAKAQLVIDPTDNSQDAIVTACILGAVAISETRTNRRWMQQTWTETMAVFPSRLDTDGYYRLPLAPLVKVNSVKYYLNNSLSTMSPTDYKVDMGIPGRIRFDNYPNYDDRADAIQIEFIVGYGADGAVVAAQQAAVPADVKSWLLLTLTTLYEQRSIYYPGSLADIKTMADEILFPYTLTF